MEYLTSCRCGGWGRTWRRGARGRTGGCRSRSCRRKPASWSPLPPSRRHFESRRRPSPKPLLSPCSPATVGAAKEKKKKKGRPAPQGIDGLRGLISTPLEMNRERRGGVGDRKVDEHRPAGASGRAVKTLGGEAKAKGKAGSGRSVGKRRSKESGGEKTWHLATM